jgi:hypothetical protein
MDPREHLDTHLHPRTGKLHLRQRPRTPTGRSLEEILETVDQQGCWWGIFAGSARCREPATWEHVPELDGHGGGGYMRQARWCEAHHHAHDRRLRQKHGTEED